MNNRFIRNTLRIFKKKQIKLFVLGLSLTGLCISSGASFAKYKDENYGNGNASAARFGINLYYDTNNIQMPTSFAETNDGYYAFVSTFRVDFSECEVKCNYSLSVKLLDVDSSNYSDTPNLSYTSFILNSLPSNVYTLSSSGRVNAPLKDEWLTPDSFSYSINTVYYAYSEDNINFTWNNLSSDDNYEVNLIDNKSINLDVDVHYYKIMFFNHFTSEGIRRGLENSKFMYSIEATQEV